MDKEQVVCVCWYDNLETKFTSRLVFRVMSHVYWHSFLDPVADQRSFKLVTKL